MRSLAGFTGLILSLTGAFAPALLDSKLGKIGQPIAEVAFFVAIVSLLLAVLVAVMGVLMPQKYRSMGTEQVANFLAPPFNERTHCGYINQCSGRLLTSWRRTDP